MTVDLEEIVERSTKLRPETKRKYRLVARRWTEFAGADPAGWSPLLAQDFYYSLIKPKQDGGSGLKVNSAAGFFRGLQYISQRYSVLYGAHDFAAGIEMSRNEARTPLQPLSVEGARALLAACAGDDPIAIRDRAIVTLGLTTGARRASITSIQFESFGMITPKVGIPFQSVKMLMKGGYEYDVPICRYAVAACQAWRDWLGARAVNGGPLFRSVAIPSIKGTRKISTSGLTEDGLYKALQKRAIRAGITDFHPHVLRHTFVTWTREAQVPREHVAAITGHASGDEGRASVMERVYFHKEAVAGAALASVESVFSILF